MNQFDEQKEETLSPYPLLGRRRFLALCAAGSSALLFGAACGIGGGEGGGENEGGGEGGEENEGGGENEGEDEGGGENEDEGGEEEED